MLRLKRWLSGNHAQKGPQDRYKLVFESLTRRKIRVGVKREFFRNWDAKWVLTQNVGSLGAVRAGKYPPAPPFWAPGAGFSISQRWRRSL